MPRRGNKATKAESKAKADSTCARMVRVASGTRDVDQAQPVAWQEESKPELLSSGSGDTKEGDEQATRPEYAELGQEREAEKCGAFEEKSAANSSPRWL